MDFAVALVVEQHRWPALAAPQFRDQVMQALRDIRRDWPVAERADRMAVLIPGGVIGDLCFVHRALEAGAGIWECKAWT